MANFWFKFVWDDWRNDPQLRRCSKETRGFWIDCIAAMEDQQTYFLEGTPEEICREIVADIGEFERSIAELERTKAATIVRNDEKNVQNSDENLQKSSKIQCLVKIISRRLLKKINLTEYNKLKKRESRARKAVKVMSTTPSKDQSLRVLEFKKEEETKKEEKNMGDFAKSPPPRNVKKLKPGDPRKDHPAIKAVYEVTTRSPPKELWDRIIREIGDKPDVVFMTVCYEQWRSVNGNPQNFEMWLFEPNKTKSPPAIYGAKNGTGRKGGGENRVTSAQRLAEHRDIIDQYPSESDLKHIA